MAGSIAIDTEIKTLARADTDMQRLMEIPGVGPTIASAPCGRRWHRQQFCQGARSRRMARPGSAPDIDRWQGQADSVSRSTAIVICASCSSMVRGLYCTLCGIETSPIARWADGLKERAHVKRCCGCHGQ